MTALLFGGVSIIMSTQHAKEDADRELQRKCEKTMADVSTVLSGIRFSVDFANSLKSISSKV